MKVLQINSFFSVGGPPRIVQGIYETLEANGHECVVAAGREKPYPGMKTIQIGTPLNKYWHLIMSRVFDAQGLSSMMATKRFVKQIEDYDPDVIHLHNLHGYYLNIEVLFGYLKSANKPVVWTLHDCWPFTGHCAYFDFVGCDKWKTGCYNCPQKMSYPTSAFVDSSRRNYKIKKTTFCGVKNMTIVSPSVWLADLVRQSFLREYPVKVIHNGIDLNVFKPTEGPFRQKYALEDKTIILGVAQIWSHRKGFEYFLQLARLLDERYQIVMVGLSEKEKLRLPDNIIGITRTNSVEELTEIYTAADVFVNPTLEDNFPTTNLEALACGTPVITFDTGGSPECLDETCGLVTDKGNIQMIQKGIEQIMDKKYSKKYCIRQAHLFDQYRRFRDYLRIYCESFSN